MIAGVGDVLDLEEGRPRRDRHIENRKAGERVPLSRTIDAATIDRAVRYVLANDGWFLNSSSDARRLPEIVRSASGALTAPSDDDMQADLENEGIRPLFDDAQPVAI